MKAIKSFNISPLSIALLAEHKVATGQSDSRFVDELIMNSMMSSEQLLDRASILEKDVLALRQMASVKMSPENITERERQYLVETKRIVITEGKKEYLPQRIACFRRMSGKYSRPDDFVKMISEVE